MANIPLKKESIASSKVQLVIEKLDELIAAGTYKIGDTVPSINEFSKQLSVSRDTVFKGYAELKKRKILASAPTKGYYVNNIINRVFLLLDSYSPYKDVLYNSFRNFLPENYQVDLAFHHYNYQVFQTLILNSIGKYSSYVIMNVNNGKIADVLRRIDPHKLLLLDWGQFRKEKYSYIGQDFETAALDCFKQALNLIKKYEVINIFYPADSDHPEETIKAFSKFCKSKKLVVKVRKELKKEDVVKGSMYFVFRPKELVVVMKLLKENHLKPGKDAGILIYNDMPLYEVIDKGMTVISTDFSRMGTEAAKFAINPVKTQQLIPTNLIIRGSL